MPSGNSVTDIPMLPQRKEPKTECIALGSSMLGLCVMPVIILEAKGSPNNKEHFLFFL